MSKTLATNKIIVNQTQSNMMSARSIGGAAIPEEEEHEEAFHTSSSEDQQITHEYNFEEDHSDLDNNDDYEGEESHITQVNGHYFKDCGSDTIDEHMKFSSQSF